MNSKIIVTNLKILLAAGLLFGAGYWVHSEYGWQPTIEIWEDVSLEYIVFGGLMIIGSHFARVWRVYYAFSKHKPVAFSSTLAVSFIHTTMSFLLPMRLGELVLPTLSRHQMEVDFRYASATLLLIRLFDVHVLLCLLSFFAGHLWLGNSVLLMLLLLIGGLPIGMRLIYYLSKRVKFLNFSTVLIDDHRTWFAIYGQTLSIWLVKMFAMAMLAAALGKLPFSHAYIGAILADSSALSPITGFANAVIFELAFAFPLLQMGYDLTMLVQVAVNLHIFMFIINVCIGIIGFLMLKTNTILTPAIRNS